MIFVAQHPKCTDIAESPQRAAMAALVAVPLVYSEEIPAGYVIWCGRVGHPALVAGAHCTR